MANFIINAGYDLSMESIEADNYTMRDGYFWFWKLNVNEPVFIIQTTNVHTITKQD